MYSIFCRLFIFSLFHCAIYCTSEVDRSVRGTSDSQKLKVCTSKLEKSKQAIGKAKAILKDIEDELNDVQGGNVNRKPSFHVLLTKTTRLGQQQVVVFDKVITNNGNAYDNKHGIFTAPRNGTYFFTTTYRSYQGHAHLEIVKENEVVAISGAIPGNGSTASMSAIINLKKDETVKVRHLSAYTTTELIYGNHWAMFTGYMISII